MKEAVMKNKNKADQNISANITGDVSGQVAVGQNINQSKTGVYSSVTSQEMDELRNVLAELRNKIASEAPADKKDAALERIGELEQAVTEKKPDLSTMEYVRNWFVKNLPGVAGAVVSVVVHPIVGKLVEAAGDALTSDFNKRFGKE
jgi:hypothetical protein